MLSLYCLVFQRNTRNGLSGNGCNVSLLRWFLNWVLVLPTFIIFRTFGPSLLSCALNNFVFLQTYKHIIVLMCNHNFRGEICLYWSARMTCVCFRMIIRSGINRGRITMSTSTDVLCVSLITSVVFWQLQSIFAFLGFHGQS